MALTFFSAKERIQTLEARIAELEKSNGELTKTHATATARVAELEAALKDREDKLATVNAALESATAKVTETEDSVDKRASAKALEIAGRPGAQPVPETSATKSDTELLAEFNEIRDPQKRGEFYRRHFADKLK